MQKNSKKGWVYRMIFTKDGFIRLGYTIITTMVIYLFATLALENTTIKIEFIAKSLVLGCGIWFFAELLIELVMKLWPYRVLPGYIVLAFIIAVATIGGVYFVMQVESVCSLIIICLLAEVSGITISLIYHNRYKKRLQSKLEEAKRR